LATADDYVEKGSNITYWKVVREGKHPAMLVLLEMTKEGSDLAVNGLRYKTLMPNRKVPLKKALAITPDVASVGQGQTVGAASLAGHGTIVSNSKNDVQKSLRAGLWLLKPSVLAAFAPSCLEKSQVVAVKHNVVPALDLVNGSFERGAIQTTDFSPRQIDASSKNQNHHLEK